VILDSMRCWVVLLRAPAAQQVEVAETVAPL
jgi:hypothetical protein